jgi:hypothetical protein
MPAPRQNFEGVGNVNAVMPPDPQGDVGPHHYVQWVNLSFAIWEKGEVVHQSKLVYGPADGNTLWVGFGGPCETTNNGDPITLYDPLADRWLMSQFALPHFPYGPFYQCLAISKTGDPTGAWHRYEFLMPVNKINDYPKFGVWPDGYYMSVNQYEGGTLKWGGAGVAVFERDKLLAGKIARMIYFDIGETNLIYSGMLPADLDGAMAPPANAPNYFAAWDNSTWSGGANDSLRLWEFHTDWDILNNTTFGLNGYTPNILLSTMDVDPNMCNFSRDCIPQPNTQQRLDAISDRLMYRLQYRNFGTYETLLTNHTVNVGDADTTPPLDHAGIHWFELRKNDDTWSIYQEGIYAPDSDHRWMGSIAMDRIGNIALGYSVASEQTFPSIRYTGRLSGDPLGTLAQGERSLIEGTASQTESNRWGDYSMMAVDPTDDCTFWYTQEYYQASPTQTVKLPAAEYWRTRIGAFKFPNCTTTSPGTLTGIIYESTGEPTTHSVTDAYIWVNLSPTQTLKTSSDQNGHYKIVLPPGTYTMTVIAYGYQEKTITDVTIVADTETALNVPLVPLDHYIVSGTVNDANAGWPLYAQIKLQGIPLDPLPPHNEIWTTPTTGYYSVTLSADVTHTLETYAWVPGYQSTRIELAPITADQIQPITLHADIQNCTAPGHIPAYRHLDDFEETNGEYTHTGVNDRWQWGIPTDWPQQCAGSPDNVNDRCWGTNLYGNYENNADQSLYSPRIDLSNIPTSTAITVSWWQAWAIENVRYDQAFVEVSINEGLWNKIWEHKKAETVRVDWTQLHYDISEAAGGSVQLRWRLLSDSSWTYEGLYVDNVLITAGCEPQEGGLVVGNVYDENTGNPLVGAVVANDRGDTTTAMATHQDAKIDDALYTIFSLVGSHPLTATLPPYYGSRATSLTIPRRETTWLDFHLPAGYLTYTPSGLTTTINMSETQQFSLTLTNEGGNTAKFKLQETNRGMTPIHHLNRPSIYERLTVPSQDPSLKAPITTTRKTRVPTLWGNGAPIPTGERYRAAGVSCDGNTYYVFGGSSGYRVLNEAWQYNPVVDTWTPLADLPIALMNFEAECIDHYIYLVGGYDGDNLTNDFQIYNIARDTWIATTWPRPWAPMTAAWNGKLYAFGGSGYQDETWMYDPTTDTWNGPLAPMPTPNAYGAALTINDYIYQIGGASSNTVQRYTPFTDQWDDSGPQLQDERMSPLVTWYGDYIYTISGGGEWGNIWNAWDTTEIYNPDQWPNGEWTYDDEEIGVPGVGIAGDCVADVIWGAGGSDGYTLYDTNQYLDDDQTCHFQQPIPWLSETPITGTLPAREQQTIRFTFDTRGSEIQQPGHYYAHIVVNTDTPYKVTPIPITMTVTPPNTWGKVMGTITSLGYCDANPAPLKGANVLIVSKSGITWTLTTDVNGRYQLWLDKAYSPLTLTLTHPQHATSVFTNVAFGTLDPPIISRDVTWRLQSPCVKVSPTSIDVKIEPGDVIQQRLTLSNRGPISTTFRLREVEVKESPTRFNLLHSGGPDTFGYTYKDSNELDGPPYQWIDISTTGNAIFLRDDSGQGPIEIGFPFKFYDNEYTKFFISSNGYLSFNDADITDYGNDCPLPNSYEPNDSIYLMWDDLNPGETDPIYYETFPDCPYGGSIACLVVQYETFHFYDGSIAGTFEAILFENGNILIQFADAGAEGGRSSTTGIENDDATAGLTYNECNTSDSLEDNLAICFAFPGESGNCLIDTNVIPWLSETLNRGILKGRDSTLQRPHTATLYITVKALPNMDIGDYNAVLRLQSGDLISPQQRIPINMHISDQWQKYIYVNGKQVTSKIIAVTPGDTVSVVDHIKIAQQRHDTITFTLSDTWTPLLTFSDYAVNAQPDGTMNIPGSEIVTDTGILTWSVNNLPSDWTYRITKTFNILELYNTRQQGYITETLWIQDAEPQWSERILTIGYPTLYLPVTLKNFRYSP